MMMMAAGARMEEEFGVVFAAFISPLAVGGNALLLTKMPSGNGHGFFTLGEAMQCIGERGGPLGGPRTRDGSSHLVRPPDY